MIEQRCIATTKYHEFIKSLELDSPMILLESQHGLIADGDFYYIAKDLLGKETYGGFKLCFVASNRAEMRKIKARFNEFDSGRFSVVKMRSRAYFKQLASAGLIICDDALPECCTKSDEQKYIMLWHATAFKRLGLRDRSSSSASINRVRDALLSADYIVFPNGFTRDRVLADYDATTVSEEKILVSPYPREEILLDDEDCRTLRAELGLAGKAVYAFMPTLRRNGSNLKAHLKKIDSLLEDDELMYVKVHPLDKMKIRFGKFKHVKAWPEDIETYRFLNICDKLVTDFSSVAFDFAISRKEVIMYAFEEGEFLKERGLYMSLESLPFSKVYSEKPLVKKLRSFKPYNEEGFIEEFY